MNKSIELSAEEANGLIDMMHIAVKAEGLNVARFCSNMQIKLKEAFEVEETEEAEA